MRQLLYRRYWNRIQERWNRQSPGVSQTYFLGYRPQMIDYFSSTPGTIPEKLIYNALVVMQVSFYYGWYFGDVPWTEEEEHYTPDFLLPDYSIIIEVQGGYWHSREGSYEYDYIRAIHFVAAGYKVRTIPEHEILIDPLEAIRKNIPELDPPSILGTKFKPSPRMYDPAAALRARARKYPKQLATRQRDVMYGRQGVMRAYRVAGWPVEREEPIPGPVFSHEHLRIEDIKVWKEYGEIWFDYLRALKDYFQAYPRMKEKYPEIYAYYLKWRTWWYRYGHSGL